jgi:2-amino-4-hydroxy-6-hydroxymethyldihydropteridine diphosphokinase
MKAWIGLGGNREDSAALIAEALMRISASPGVGVRRSSRCYRSTPWGLTDQPDFVNAVAELETVLEPLPLLRLLLTIEHRLGRRRDGARWGPRCIDLDLLTYEGLRLRSSELVLPHPEMQQRAFVLVPLLELEPGFEIPGVGPAADCLEDIGASEAAAVVPLPSTSNENRS